MLTLLNMQSFFFHCLFFHSQNLHCSFLSWLLFHFSSCSLFFLSSASLPFLRVASFLFPYLFPFLFLNVFHGSPFVSRLHHDSQFLSQRNFIYNCKIYRFSNVHCLVDYILFLHTFLLLFFFLFVCTGNLQDRHFPQTCVARAYSHSPHRMSSLVYSIRR